MQIIVGAVAGLRYHLNTFSFVEEPCHRKSIRCARLAMGPTGAKPALGLPGRGRRSTLRLHFLRFSS